MPGNTIKEFLASVGFAADEKSLKAALTKVAAFGAAVSAVAGAIYAGVVKAAQGEAQMAAQAERLGTSSERIRELGYVAEQAGASLDAVTRSMEALVSKNPRIKDAAAAIEEAGARMRDMTQAQQRQFASRMGIDLSLIPALTGDVAGLTDEYRRMYAVAGTDARQAAQASRAFMAELGKLKTLAGMLARGVAMAFIGKIRRDIEHLRRLIMDNFDKIKRLFEAVIGVVLRVAGAVGAFVYRVVKWVSQAVAWFDRLDDGTRRVLLALLGLYAAWRVLNLGFLATPLGALIAALGVLFLLVDDFLTYMEGGQSLIDWGPWIGHINAALDALRPLMDAAHRLGERLLPLILSAAQRVWRFIKDVFAAVGQVISQTFGGGIGDATGFVAALGDAIEGLAVLIGWVFNAVALVAIEVFRGALGAIIDVVRLLLRVFTHVAEYISALIRGDWAGATEAWLSVLQDVWDFLAGLVSRAAALWGNLLGRLARFLGLREIFSRLARFFTQAFREAVDAVVATFQGWLASIRAFGGRLRETFVGLVDGIAALFGRLKGAAAQVFTGLAGFIATAIGRAVDMATAIFQAWLDGVTAFAGLLLRVFEGLAEAIAALFRGDLAGAADALLGVLRDIWDFLAGIVGRVADLVKGLGSKIMATLGIDVDGLAALAETATAAIQPTAAPALVPSPAQAASIDNSRRAVDLKADTKIYVQGAGDPAAVGNQVATRQRQVNADILRHAQGAAR